MSGPASLRDGWRLALGTLTALPTPPPSVVTPAVARAAVLWGPVAVLPLGAGVLALAWLGTAVGWSPLVVAVLVVGWLALATRVLHWDGLSDTVDGLTASYDRERSLAVMKSGTSGPAGVVATVVVAGLQVAAFATLVSSQAGAVAAGIAVCLSRLALPLACVRGVPPARKDGLGHPLAGVVAPWQALLVWLVCAGVAALALVPLGFGVAGLVAGPALAAVAVALLVTHCVRRLGGVTGDVFGAAVEIALAAALLGLSLRI
ncbi:adenosylcobinamide-GDP ribazoletransferase [Nocardioides sp. Y6]|uniref:Adenosylcobinamide-GDP ribazoletransferase n=1 Tax=Nocardioides malaquae TaxID=2773426 RepID=A0ABR9RVR8_9ACTN|nr:adenosylcobinamide-GDP ribazoletransferase [Nocardioides malaquae]MBE7325621.1 adenosylcobinamide-GDP ribazoletransferase [Nocardioides malaquae]